MSTRLPRDPRLGALIAFLCAACQPSTPPVPPPPVEAREVLEGTGPVVSSEKTVLGLALPRGEDLESSLLQTQAIVEAGRSKVVLEVRRPSATGPNDGQARLVRDLARDGCSVVIVAVNDTSISLVEAIDAVQKAGTPVLVLGGRIETETKVHRVDTVSFQKGARELIAAMLTDAKAGPLSTEAPPILLVRESNPDAHTEARVEALVAALTEVGLEPIHVPFLNTEADAANALDKALAEHPQTTLVLSESDFGVVGAEGVRNVRGSKLPTDSMFPFLVGGFLTTPQHLSAVKRGGYSAVLDWNLQGMARAAVNTAIALAQREQVPDLVEVPTKLVKPPVPTSTVHTVAPPQSSAGPPPGRDTPPREP